MGLLIIINVVIHLSIRRYKQGQLCLGVRIEMDNIAEINIKLLRMKTAHTELLTK